MKPQVSSRRTNHPAFSLKEVEKGLTAEVAEHAEGRTTKGSRCKGERDIIPSAFRMAKTLKGLSKKDLCVLGFLFVHPLVFMRGESKGGRSLIPKRKKEPQIAEKREDAERRK